MSELSAPIDTAPSTQLSPETAPANPSSYKPEQAPEPKVEAPKPLTARQALEKAAEEAKVADPKADPKPEAAPKEGPKQAEPAKEAQPRDNGKFAPREQQEPSVSTTEAKEAGQDGEATRPSEGRGHEAPPARFLPKAKEEWASTPESVRQEIHRAIQNTEKGMEEYRESHEFRKELKQFEDMAKANGTTVKQAIENYVAIDQQLRTNPAAALERILKSIGYTPQQYAQHVMGQQQQQAQNPNYAPMQQMQQQIQQMAQTIQQLTQGTQQDRESARHAEIQRMVIEPFKTAHPRYAELEQDIAFFLNSDRIPSTLNERQRLETAYDMAERINPAPHQATQARLNTAPTQKPLNPAGDKSIKGAPGAADNVGGDKGKLKTRDAIRAAMAELGVQ